MKKILLTIGIFTGLTAVSQDLENKNGFKILPEEGDIALGFDAVPFINFGLNAVNIMNDTGDGATHPGFVNGFNQNIVAKYYYQSDLAFRARLGINSLRSSTRFYGDDPMTPSAVDPEEVLIMTEVEAGGEYTLALGAEFRRGHNRLQGFYGGELFTGFANNRVVNKYEIEYSAEAQDSGYVAPGETRLLNQKSGTQLIFGARGFVGVEYFILPKISLGAEFGWALGMRTNPRGSAVVETWGIQPGNDPTSDPEAFTTEASGPEGGLDMGTAVDLGNPLFGAGTASLSVIFHF
jgi:hypothetical protein